MLHLSDISFAYPGRDAPAFAADGVTLSPAVTILAGPNAGGKTTLLLLLAGLLQAQRGAIRENGTALAAADLRRMARMVMQDPEPQILGVRVGEDIMLGRAASNLGAGFDAEAHRLAEKFGLKHAWHETVDALSYGQKRKLCLLHALLAGPRLLLLDEPFAGLDYPSALELRGFIRDNAAAGIAQAVSTHELDPVFSLADRLVVVKDGAVAAEGTPAELEPRLEEWSVRRPGKGWK